MTASLADTAAPVLRQQRRTAIVTMTSTTAHDVIRLCEPECRNEFLLDLGVPHRQPGGWVYPSRGTAVVTVTWNQKTCDVSWVRQRLNALPCDLCEHEWRYRIPELVASEARKAEARAARPPTERQLEARAAFAARKHLEAAERADKLSQELVST
jgi:hypothetical protein